MPFCLDLCSSVYCLLTQTGTDSSLDLEGYCFFPIGPSSTVCVLFISPVKIKLGSSCTGGSISIFNPRDIVASNRRRKTQSKEMESISDGKTRLLGNTSLLKSICLMHNISMTVFVLKASNFSSFKTSSSSLLSSAISVVAAGFYTVCRDTIW